MPVDTGKVIDRRKLRFFTPEEMEADVAILVDAERAGRLARLGNWSLGQVLNHLGSWVAFAFDGNPLKPPFFVRWIVGRRKNKYLNEAMPAGVRIPRVEGGTLAWEPSTLDEGLAKFSAAWGRMKKEAPTLPNPLFGQMTHDEWIRLQLRHAELHLSFFKP
jgi:Protein of unknown function (DUF1569)